MSFAAVLGITLILVIVVVLGIALVTYLSSLARSAYELKVELRRDLEEGMKRVEAESTRQTKWARGELMAEIERCRAATTEDLERRQADAQLGVLQREETWRQERAALEATVAQLEERLARLEPRPIVRMRAAPEQVTAAAEPAPAPTPPAAPSVAIPLALQNFEAPPQTAKAKAR